MFQSSDGFPQACKKWEHWEFKSFSFETDTFFVRNKQKLTVAACHPPCLSTPYDSCDRIAIDTESNRESCGRMALLILIIRKK